MAVSRTTTRLGACVALLVAGCSDSSQPVAVPSEPKPQFSTSTQFVSLTLAPGESSTLVSPFHVLSSGHCGPASVTWSTSAPQVATVTNAGFVQAIAVGDALLTTLSCGRQATASVSVVDPAAPANPAAPSPSVPITGSTVELPRAYVDSRSIAPTARTITVNAGEDLQAALASARSGDVVVLQAGATFTGNFSLPARSDDGWITIRSSAAASLPPQGVRVTPRDAELMPRLVSPNPTCALTAGTGAARYQIVGLEITTASSLGYSYGLICLGQGGEHSVAELPSDIILDRLYLHGVSWVNLSRCLSLNGVRAAIVDSYLSECHSSQQDAQGIAGWNGPGPFKIVNNYVEGTGENVMFGGADPSIPNLVPS
ncbi:MAG: Ig-like domain-containing protein, partial [Gemmatimonadaceae bacterium]